MSQQRPDSSLTFEQKNTRFVMTLPVAGTDCELGPGADWPGAPQGGARIFSILAKRVKVQIDQREALHIVVKISRHAFECVERGLFGRHTVPHVLDDGVRAAGSDILFAAASGTGSAHILIEPQSAAEDGRIADSAGQFPCHATSGGDG